MAEPEPESSVEKDMQITEETEEREQRTSTEDKKKKGLPERSNISMPEKISSVSNPCRSLEVDDEVQRERDKFSNLSGKVQKRADKLLKKHPPPAEFFRGNKEEKAVALTIDTGIGGADGIEEILGVAEHYDIDLTFFLTGCWVLENPELTRKIFKEGHSIGNHTLTHANLSHHSDSFARREIGETSRIIKETLGFKPAIFRKPHYAGADRVINIAAEFDKISVQGYPDLGDTAGWSSDTKGRDVFNLVKRKTDPGAIWVMHNLSRADLHAFEDIVRFHLENGYELISVEEMLLRRE